MTKNHNYYLDQAYQLAEKNLGKTGLNPSVGAIVVKDDSVISSGVTSYQGRPHAEFNALNKKIDFQFKEKRKNDIEYSVASTKKLKKFLLIKKSKNQLTSMIKSSLIWYVKSLEK